MKWTFKSYRVFADDCKCGLIHKDTWACGVIGFRSTGYGATREKAILDAQNKLNTELNKQYVKDEVQYMEMEA